MRDLNYDSFRLTRAISRPDDSAESVYGGFENCRKRRIFRARNKVTFDVANNMSRCLRNTVLLFIEAGVDGVVVDVRRMRSALQRVYYYA